MFCDFCCFGMCVKPFLLFSFWYYLNFRERMQQSFVINFRVIMNVICNNFLKYICQNLLLLWMGIYRTVDRILIELTKVFCNCLTQVIIFKVHLFIKLLHWGIIFQFMPYIIWLKNFQLISSSLFLWSLLVTFINWLLRC